MSDDSVKQLPISTLPAPDTTAPGTITAEELSLIIGRARAEVASTVVNVGSEQQRREDREAEHRDAWSAAEQERRAIATIDADARRRRGEGNLGFAQAAVTVAAATAIGMAIAGPVGGLVAASAGWLIDRVVEGR